MTFFLDYQWEIFILAEILSLISLLLFGFFRYFLGRKHVSFIFIITFLVLLILEALLGLLIYTHTGEFSTFQIVITLFVIYACTFGIFDFLRLDRWMRRKIGKLRNVELLTEKDYAILERNKNPKYLAKKYRISASVHLLIFLLGQSLLWFIGTSDLTEMVSYLTDFSWIEAGTAANSPYANETMYAIGMLWGVIFIIDFIYSMSYTIFPSGKS
ncbi:hypothetical protein HXA34_06210 [Salipaludibacillus agaradhaerens]|uniref:hypothetical protein n=1 Tax=Salipaludibacillus agaradhaerens TaxID=76935 RepID=UPI0021512236|nr:hypothetical protein [Salipaludibacillus agaradhaerens]MCR6105886.1 hypothetical protein [Salipaludibacillus agaradhaerens]MCR6117920.1 hypothetical protein [Salipaludibacillus agaradhaerens]UJW57063.1 hypothetical protein HXZ66_06345 [Bacillus sp. A116_S68]